MYKAFFSIPGTADPVVTAAGTVLFDQVPTIANGGGVAITQAGMHAGAGTGTVKILDMGTSGTAAATPVGTIATFAIAQAAAGGTVLVNVDYFLAAGSHVGYLTAAGTIVQPIRGWLTGSLGR